MKKKTFNANSNYILNQIMLFYKDKNIKHKNETQARMLGIDERMEKML